MPAASQLALAGWDPLDGQEGDLIKLVLMTLLLIAWFLMGCLVLRWLLLKGKPIGRGLLGRTLKSRLLNEGMTGSGHAMARQVAVKGKGLG